jgi:hypothetical protein
MSNQTPEDIEAERITEHLVKTGVADLFLQEQEWDEGVTAEEMIAELEREIAEEEARNLIFKE